MGLENPPFTRMTLGDQPKVDSFTVRLNEDERAMLERAKKVLEQPKDSTAMKQLAVLGAIVLHDGLTGKILETVFINKRRNKRTGIIDYE